MKKKKIAVGMMIIVSMVGVCWGWQETAKEQLAECGGHEGQQESQDKIADVTEAADLKAKYEAAKERASQAMGDIGAHMRANAAEL